MRLSNAENMRAADRHAIEIEGIPSEKLMEVAAAHLAKAVWELAGENQRIAVFCGSGNNGGDGVGAAAMLTEAGFEVRTFLVGSREKMTRDTRLMEERLVLAGGQLEEFPTEAVEIIKNYVNSCGALIDAIFGIGLRRPVEGDALAAVRLMNASGVPVAAADIPSGVAADTGTILGEAVLCKRTVTFSRAKPGHFLEPGCVYCGEVTVCPIGISEETLCASETEIRAVLPGDVTLPERPRISHKYYYGKLIVFGGCVGYTGAPNLCARAAVRGGAGLVSLGVPEAIYPICAVKNDEAMPFPLRCDAEGRFTADAAETATERAKGASVLLLGPGMGRSEGVRAFVKTMLRTAAVPLILDADALWAISDDPAILRELKVPVILTPHEGEFARLGGELGNDRLAAARRFAAEYGCILILKGHHSIVALPSGEAHIIAAGNPGMARGGSGDVLAGILGAMLCQFDAEKAAVTAAWLHAAAGDACAEEKGEYGMTPTDIIEKLPEIMKGITR